jgi:hypothetical protein
MEVNAFLETVKQTEKSKWYSIDDFSDIISYQLKLAGVEWKSNIELVRMLVEMIHVGFLEYHKSDPLLVRPLERFYD